MAKNKKEQATPDIQESTEVKKETIKTSFKIDKDIHLALKQYSLIEEEDMAIIAFEKIVKPFLEKEGFYPPRKK